MIEFIGSFLGRLLFAKEDILDRKRRLASLAWTVIGLIFLGLVTAVYCWFVAHMARSLAR